MTLIYTDWLELAGTEVGNAIRTLTYVRRGLLGSRGGNFRVTLNDNAALEEDCGYSDTYAEDYEGPCENDPQSLACYCATISETRYVSPANDPAPWFDAARGESGQFLGFVPTGIEVEPVLERSVSGRSRGGGVVGRLRASHRTVVVEGVLFASTAQGLSWGERWLTQVLRGTVDAGCGPDVLRLLPSCPEEPDSERFFRELHRAGIVDGPACERLEAVRGCFASRAEFEIVAGSEFLRAPEEECLAETALGTGVHHCRFEGPPTIGDTATILTLRAGSPGSSLRDVVVTLAPVDADGKCPTSEPTEFTYTVDFVPRGGRLVVDAAERTVTVYDENDDVFGSFDRLDWTGAWEWMTAEPGEEKCLTVDASGAATNPGSLVEITTVDREL